MLSSFIQDKHPKWLTGCLLPVEQQTPMSPILLLEDLELVSMATFFGELLDPLLQRGMQYAFSLTGIAIYSSC